MTQETKTTPAIAAAANDTPMEEIVVAAGHTVVTGRTWPPKTHPAGSRIKVTAAEVVQLRASGHAIDPTAPPVRVQNAMHPDAHGSVSVGVGAAEPRVNPGTIGGPV